MRASLQVVEWSGGRVIWFVLAGFGDEAADYGVDGVCRVEDVEGSRKQHECSALLIEPVILPRARPDHEKCQEGEELKEQDAGDGRVKRELPGVVVIEFANAFHGGDYRADRGAE
jgi:hypothetical protein